jgi:myo-inositol-1(or 4)-monophosphatase
MKRKLEQELSSAVLKRKPVAIKAIRLAGKILRENFAKKIKAKAKADRDFVTDIDLKADQAISQLIKINYPDDEILSEESRYEKRKNGFTWIIDPIDGTHNYIHHIDIFGTSIALAFKGKVLLGAIYMPLSGQLYIAEKGKGAFLNGKRIRVSRRKLSAATLIYDSSIRINKRPMLASLGRLSERVFNIRMFGSTVRSLAYVAEGKAEAEIEFNDKVWDFAAGLLLVEEAGGMASDFQGRPWNIHTHGYVASNGLIHEKLLRLLP